MVAPIAAHTCRYPIAAVALHLAGALTASAAVTEIRSRRVDDLHVILIMLVADRSRSAAAEAFALDGERT